MMGLDELIPPTRRVTIGGRSVDVSPLRMKQIPGFSRAIAKPWGAIVSGEYLAAILEWPEEITDAISIATGLDRAFLSDSLPNEFLGLATAVFEVNLDFFARAVLPAATELGKRMQTILQTPSALQPGSSAGATGTTTSLATPLPN